MSYSSECDFVMRAEFGSSSHTCFSEQVFAPGRDLQHDVHAPRKAVRRSVFTLRKRGR